MKTSTLLFTLFLSAPPALALTQPPVPEPPQSLPIHAIPEVPPAARPESLPQAPESPRAPRAAQAPAPAAPVVAPAPPTRKRGQMVNVRIDVTLSDSKGAPKVLTMTVADQESGMNRTTAVVVPGATSVDYSFNADASPEVVGDRIRLRLTADAVVPVEAERPTAIQPKLALRQSQTVILNDGETVEIARAADPSSARTFILSVKATIQR